MCSQEQDHLPSSSHLVSDHYNNMANIQVRHRATQTRGVIDEREFDPRIYEALQETRRDPKFNLVKSLPAIAGGLAGFAVGGPAGAAAGAGLSQLAATLLGRMTGPVSNEMASGRDPGYGQIFRDVKDVAGTTAAAGGAALALQSAAPILQNLTGRIPRGGMGLAQKAGAGKTGSLLGNLRTKLPKGKVGVGKEIEARAMQAAKTPKGLTTTGELEKLLKGDEKLLGRLTKEAAKSNLSREEYISTRIIPRIQQLQPSPEIEAMAGAPKGLTDVLAMQRLKPGVQAESPALAEFLGQQIGRADPYIRNVLYPQYQRAALLQGKGRQLLGGAERLLPWWLYWRASSKLGGLAEGLE